MILYSILGNGQAHLHSTYQTSFVLDYCSALLFVLLEGGGVIVPEESVHARQTAF